MQYFGVKNLTTGFVQVEFFFSIVALHDVNEGGTPLYGHFSRMNAPVHVLTTARACLSTSFIRQHCTELCQES